MDSDAHLDQEYENLNDAILRAILLSKEVQDILIRFKKQGQMNDKAVLNLFLSLDELYQMIDEKPTNPNTCIRKFCAKGRKIFSKRSNRYRWEIIDF